MFKRLGLFGSAALLATTAQLGAEEFQPWHAFGEDAFVVMNLPMSAEYVEMSESTKGFTAF